MNAARDIAGDAARQRFLALLDTATARKNPVVFWWRDDDAVTATPELARLLDMARRFDLPLGLAVVPKNATTELAAAVADVPRLSILQHGWRHRNHAGEGAKKSELGDDRPLAEVLEELRQGFTRLTALFPDRFLPVLVPPWNRITKSVSDARREVGLVGLSTFGKAPADDPHVVNAHLDIFEWRPKRSISRAVAYGNLAGEMERRLVGDTAPIGIMTHHLVHEGESWALLDEIFGLIATYPGVRWPAVAELFRIGER